MSDNDWFDNLDAGALARTYTRQGLPCPGCGRQLNMDTNTADGSPPSSGDALVCVYCSTISLAVIGPFGFALQALDDAEQQAAMAVEPQVATAVAVTRSYQRGTGGPPA